MTDETKSPRELLEEDVISISEPGRKKIKISLSDGTDYVFAIIPLSFEILRTSEDQVGKIIREFNSLSKTVDEIRTTWFKFMKVNRSVDSGGDGQPEPPSDTAEELWEKMVETIMNPTTCIDIKNHAESVLKAIIQIGSDADYQMLSKMSIWTVIKVVKIIINHNYTDRLRDFYSGDSPAWTPMMVTNPENRI